MPATCCRTRWISCSTSSATASRTPAVASGLLALLRDDREVPDTWVATYQFEKLGRTVTFTGSMNTGRRSQPVEICGRDATLRFDAIAHNVTRFQILPAEHNTQAGPAQGLRAGQDAQAAQSHGGLAELHPQPRHAEMLDGRGVHRNGDLPHVAGVVPAERRMVRWDAAQGRDRVRQNPFNEART